MKISVCSIMKNEEKQVEDYVHSVQDYVDEILIVDNGSTDQTYSMAKRSGATVYSCLSSFDEARNVYLQKAKGDWILVLDADERISPNHLDALMNDISSSTTNNINGFIVPHLQYFGKGKWATWYIPRLFRKNHTLYYDDMIHGSITKAFRENNLLFSYGNYPIHHFDGLISAEHNYCKRVRNIALLEQQIECEPLRASFYNYYAQELLSLCENNRAADMIKKGYDLDTDKHTYATLFYSQIMYAIGEFGKAAKYAREQIDLSRRKRQAHDYLLPRHIGNADSARVILAQCLLENGNASEALALCEESIHEMPGLAHNYMNAYQINKDKTYLEQAIKSNPMLRKKRYTAIRMIIRYIQRSPPFFTH